jgi:cytochrome c-type biogenesis protein CcmF
MVNGTQSNVDVKMRVGDTAQLAGYDFQLTGISDAPGPNYTAARGQIAVSRDGKPVATLTPEKRVYTARGMPMTEASLAIGPLGDIYVSMGEQIDDTTWIVRLYHKPFISWIWVGAAMMALGGIFAAADRRYRKMASRTVPQTGARQSA